eukprot:gene43032-53403_t
MGPSGAGKSSLLNVLAGRSSSGGATSIEGMITVGGTQINPVAYRKNIAYVMQDNAMMATATPREALRFSANMRLPGETTSAEIEDLVTHLLEELGLTVCADVLIGGALIKGISGGQAKRTSVGPVDEIVSYYSKLGCPCPENYNPSDFVMSLAQSDSVDSLQAR